MEEKKCKSTKTKEKRINNAESVELVDAGKIITPPPKVLYTVNGDLVCNKTTQTHIKLVEMFDGEYIRNNDGTHLDGGIAYDKL